MSYCEKYGYQVPTHEELDKVLNSFAQNIENVISDDVLKTCFSLMDLTSLKTEDTPASIAKLLDKINHFQEAYPEYPMPASVCVFSNFVAQVATGKNDPEVHTTAVSGCFPTSQTFLDVKVLECTEAVKAGADEVDVVLPLNSFLVGDYASASEEIKEIRKAVDKAAPGRKITLKVILETGLLVSREKIAEASFLAMEAGADFIKTSTGKVNVNATPAAAYIMCQCIAAYYAATSRKVGFKPAGGISSAQDAVVYYSIVMSVLGKEWLNKSLFRFGVSRMANNILSAVEKKTVVFF